MKSETRKKPAKRGRGAPRKWDSPEQMQEAIDSYYAKCEARFRNVATKEGLVVSVPWPEPYTIQGLAVALDLTTEGLLEYEKRAEFSATVKKAKARVEADKTVRMLDGYGYGAGFIFDLKHNHGWKDTQHLEHTVTELSPKGRALLDQFSWAKREEEAGEPDQGEST